MSLGQVSLPVLRFSPVSIIPPNFHNHLHVPSVVNRTEWQMGGAWEPSNSRLLPVFLLSYKWLEWLVIYSWFCSQFNETGNSNLCTVTNSSPQSELDLNYWTDKEIGGGGGGVHRDQSCADRWRTCWTHLTERCSVGQSNGEATRVASVHITSYMKGRLLFTGMFLGAVAKLRKATVSFNASVRPSVRMQLGSHWTDFHKIWVFF